MLRVVFKILGVLVVCLVVGVLCSFTVAAFALADAVWLGWVVTLVLMLSVGYVLGDLW